MKWKNLILGLALAAGVLVTGCVGPQKPITYSNLTEDSIRYDLDSLLQLAGVSEEKRGVLFHHVDQINSVMKPTQLTEGFLPMEGPRYDPYDVGDAWDVQYPDFLGYNCRITAFSLAEDSLLTVEPPESAPDTELLEFDVSALQSDSSAFPEGEWEFISFFSPVVTEDTKDVKIHAGKVKDSWQDRGIRFRKNERISMINVFFHMQEENKNLLYVGHSGVLLPTPDGDLWFLEKLSFQEPYQVVRFDNRTQLQEYLMNKYDLDEGQPMAKPFIFENDSLMKP